MEKVTLRERQAHSTTHHKKKYAMIRKESRTFCLLILVLEMTKIKLYYFLVYM